ncbi:DUF2927 domain-containing protein [Winogradskyella wichelsiae]|uniref:DUF2927 domain-containing protein n=1 Tax=Winogradskyella wichelsiae TaxID=2697007 RepID=UPI003EF6A7B9
MIRFCSLFITLFISISFLSAQNHSKIKSDTLFYIPKIAFEHLYKKTDSIGFKIKGNDTLIRVSKVIKHKQSPGVRVAYEFKDSTFLKYYKKIAFQSYKNEDSIDTKPMKYWKHPIKVFFAKGIKNDVSKKVMSFLKTINEEVDSLSITQVKRLEDSNYTIYTSEDYQYESKMNTTNLADYHISWRGNNQIYKGAIRINNTKVTSKKIQILKIQEMFIGSLGWFKFSNDFSCESYFSDCYSDNKQLTKFDWDLLKYHYSYGICKGTTRNVFAEQHEKSKEMMKKYGKETKMYFLHN